MENNDKFVSDLFNKFDKVNVHGSVTVQLLNVVLKGFVLNIDLFCFKYNLSETSTLHFIIITIKK